MRVDAALDGLDVLFAHTVYRVVQEAMTNVLRHARAKSTDIAATAEGAKIVVEVSDDGVGLAEGTPFGRGLTGMRDRVRALGGTFELSRTECQTFIRCRLPHLPARLQASATARDRYQSDGCR
jgi:two-component system, NarL family, sensor histidine kinase UhpB